jgi:hypothetical protein
MSNNTTRKPRGDCLLKNLPSDQQDAIFEYLDGSPDEKGHTYLQCVAWLAEQNIHTNRTQLCNWRQWYIFRLRLKWCEEAARMTLAANLGEENLSDEELSRRGNRIFSLLAVRTCDDKAWSRAQSLVIRKQRIGQIERKMEFELRRYETSVAREKEKQAEAEPKLTPDEVQERIRQIMGTE